VYLKTATYKITVKKQSFHTNHRKLPLWKRPTPSVFMIPNYSGEELAMKNRFIFILLVIFIGTLGCGNILLVENGAIAAKTSAEPKVATPIKTDAPKVTSLPLKTTSQTSPASAAISRLTYLYGEREAEVKGCLPAWGLVTLIEFDGKKILFDTGGDRDILKNNMEKVGVDAGILDLVVISHHHWEMTDGLYYLLGLKPSLPIIAPDWVIELYEQEPWSKNFRRMEKVERITPNIFLVKLHSRSRHGGPFGIDEIHVVLKTSEGLVVLQGCGHPEVVNIVQKSQEITGEQKVYLVTGGTRLLEPGKAVQRGDGSWMGIPSHNYDNDEIQDIADKLKALGVAYIVPTHCTGNTAEKIFAQTFGSRYINHKLGMKLEIPPPK